MTDTTMPMTGDATPLRVEPTAATVLADTTVSHAVEMLQNARDAQDSATADWYLRAAFGTLARFAKVSSSEDVALALTDIGMLFDHDSVNEILRASSPLRDTRAAVPLARGSRPFRLHPVRYGRNVVVCPHHRYATSHHGTR